MLEAVQNRWNCFNKIKMLKNTTVCGIMSFIAIENMNDEKLRFTKINQHKFS